MTESATAGLIFTAATFLLLAALGLLRMPDLYTRLGAATKAVTLGGGLMFAAVAVHFADIASDARAAAGIVFLLVTAPVTAHVIGRAAFHLGIEFAAGTDLADVQRGLALTSASRPIGTADLAGAHRGVGIAADIEGPTSPDRSGGARTERTSPHPREEGKDDRTS